MPRAIKNEQCILDISMPLLGEKTLKIFRFWAGPHQQGVWLRHDWFQNWKSNIHYFTLMYASLFYSHTYTHCFHSHFPGKPDYLVTD